MRRLAHGATSLSVGVKGLLRRAHMAETSQGAAAMVLYGRLAPATTHEDRQPEQRCARAQPSPAWFPVVVYQRTARVQGTLSRCERALPAPCSMPVRAHKIGVHLATTGTQEQSQDTLLQTMISAQLSDSVRFHENEWPRHLHAGCHARSRQDAGRRRRSMSRYGQQGPRRSHTVHS